MIIQNNVDLQILRFPRYNSYIISSDGFVTCLLIETDGTNCTSISKISKEKVHEIRESYPDYMENMKCNQTMDNKVFYNLLPKIVTWFMEKFPAENKEIDINKFLWKN